LNYLERQLKLSRGCICRGIRCLQPDSSIIHRCLF